MEKSFLEAVKARRSFYAISKESPISDEQIEKIISEAVLHAPSSFHSQSARVVVLFGGEHDKLWDMVKSTLQKIVPPDNFAPTEAKINSFRAGYGSALFFEDQAVVQNLQNKFPSYKDNFPLWSLQSSGMLQFIIWTALENEGLGASLQHYNPLIDQEVKKTWGLPDAWLLLSQMPFGQPTAAPGAKQFAPLEERLKVYR